MGAVSRRVTVLLKDFWGGCCSRTRIGECASVTQPAVWASVGPGGLTKIRSARYVYRLNYTHFPKSGPSGPLFFSSLIFHPHEQRNSFRPGVHGEGKGHSPFRYDLDDHERPENCRAEGR